MMVGHAVLKMCGGVEVRGLALKLAGAKNTGTSDCIRRAKAAGIEMDVQTLEAA